MADGTIAYCSRDDHAPPMFAKCLARLAQRHPTAKIEHYIGNDIAQSRNKAVVEMEGDWLWFIDTDMLFADVTLERLLRHDVPVVQTLVLMRYPPHEPVLWAPGSDVREPYLTGPPRLQQVDKLGAGGTLYRRSVFAAVPFPWFEGVLGKEDMNFSQKLHLAGVPMFVDLTTACRHLTPCCVYPVYDTQTGKWSIRYEMVNGDSLTIGSGPSRILAPPPNLVLR
jgi:hypothetical protein